MNLYEDGLSHLFGQNPYKKVFKRALAGVLLFAMVVTPISFWHAIWDYSKHRTSMVMRWYFNPMMKQIDDNFAAQMKKARLSVTTDGP